MRLEQTLREAEQRCIQADAAFEVAADHLRQAEKERRIAGKLVHQAHDALELELRRQAWTDGPDL
jgi:hypothetical protein